jgi:hypothetical protein
MSISFPLGGVRIQVHMDATLQLARRIIARLLREDAAFFREHHYLNPLGVDDSDNPRTREILFFDFFCQKFLFLEHLYCVFTAIFV